jgi:hypothetical protein
VRNTGEFGHRTCAGRADGIFPDLRYGDGNGLVKALRVHINAVKNAI